MQTKNITLGLCVLFVLPITSFAGNLKGIWIDEGIYSGFEQYKSNHDLKSFCRLVVPSGENVDIATICTPAGKVVSCALNSSYSSNGGANCQDRGTWQDSSMQVTFDSTPGAKIPGTSRELDNADHLEFSFKFTSNTTPPQAQIMLWEVHRLLENEISSFTRLFQSCAN